jgi:hypothetical protein
MVHPRRRLGVPATIAVLAWSAFGFAAAQENPPPLAKEAVRAFLLTAEVVKSKAIGKGITHPMRLTLTDGRLTHDAAFVSVNEQLSVMRFQSGRTELDFVDSYKYSIAAFGLAELLGLDDLMPVTVEREWKGQKGALSWWVDDVMFDEEARLKQKVTPPDPEAWNRQMFRMRVFTQLVVDTDRNLGNVLITQDWELRMIDFTRAFRKWRRIQSPADLARCDRQLLARLRELTRDGVAAKTRAYLGNAEIDALMARRDLIVAHFDKLIAEKGDAQVLY